MNIFKYTFHYKNQRKMEEREISFRAEFYNKNAAVPNGYPYKTITTFVRVNESDRTFHLKCIEYKEYLLGASSTTDITGLSFTFKEWSDLEKIENFVNEVMKGSVSDVLELTIEVEDGICYEISRDSNGTFRGPKEKGFKEICIKAMPEIADLQFFGPCTGVSLPYFTKEIDGKVQDKNNLKKFLEFLKEVRSPKLGLGNIIDDRIKNILEYTKWGKEVIKHVRDGDKCYENGLIDPALGSYIHAFEWAIISYLESECNRDIIEEEKKGKPYYFARGDKNLLSTLIECKKDIDQKTIDKIRELNNAERRWMAHHKSGKTLEAEVKAVRDRLKEFLKILYSQK